MANPRIRWWPAALAGAVVVAHAAAASGELAPHEPWVLPLYLLALVPPLTGFLRASPGSKDRLGASGLIVVQALLGVGPMFLIDPVEQGFGRAVVDLFSTAAVVGVGFLTALAILFRRKPRPQT